MIELSLTMNREIGELRKLALNGQLHGWETLRLKDVLD